MFAFRTAGPFVLFTPFVVGLLTNWDQYLAPTIAHMLDGAAHPFMLVAGVIEVIAGLLVALRPKIGAHVVAAWLAGIAVNLLISGQYSTSRSATSD